MQIHEVLESLKEEIKAVADYNIFYTGTHKINEKLIIYRNATFDKNKMSFSIFDEEKNNLINKLSLYFYKAITPEKNKSVINYRASGSEAFGYIKDSTMLGVMNYISDESVILNIPFTEEDMFQKNTIVQIPDISVLNSLFSTSKYIVDSSALQGIGIGFSDLKESDVESIRLGLIQYLINAKIIEDETP